MTEVAAPGPTNYATVTWSLFNAGADGSDVNANPDFLAMRDKIITIVPSYRALMVHTDGDVRSTIALTEVRCKFDGEGKLVTEDGRPVRLSATDDPDLSVQGWYWYIKEYPQVQFATPGGTVVDISAYILVPPREIVKEWIARIPELIDLVDDLVGVVDIQNVAGTMVVSLSDGTTREFPMPASAWTEVTGKPTAFPPALPLEASEADPAILAEDGSDVLLVYPEGVEIHSPDYKAQLAYGALTMRSPIDDGDYTSYRKEGIYVGTPEGLSQLQLPTPVGGTTRQLATVDQIGGASVKLEKINIYDSHLMYSNPSYWYSERAAGTVFELSRTNETVNLTLDLEFQLEGFYQMGGMVELFAFDAGTANYYPELSENSYMCVGGGWVGELGAPDERVAQFYFLNSQLYVHVPASTSAWSYGQRLRGSASWTCSYPIY